MLRLPAISLVLMVAFASAALAATMPTPLAQDPRIRQYVYDANTVYQLDVYTPYISTIQFGDGEIVESIQIGDSASWQIVRLSRGDILSVKPLIEGAYTNMTVYTDRRVYTFDLRAHRGVVGSQQVSYRVAFVYPSEAVTEFSRLPTSIRPPSRPEPSGYRVAGHASFSPTSIYDTGQQTIFLLPAHAPRPAVFRVNGAGEESIVNVRHAGDRMIVDGVSERWTLRIGDEEICVARGSANEADDEPAVTSVPLPERDGRHD